MKLPIRHGREPAAYSRQRFDDSTHRPFNVMGIFLIVRGFLDNAGFAGRKIK